MEIRVLGAHNSESDTVRLTSLLVDGTLAVDAGGLTSSLSFSEQTKVDNILLTHCHYDHIRDVAAMALNVSYFRKTVCVYSQASTLDNISSHMLNGVIYPKFNEIKTPDYPPVEFRPLQIYKVENIGGYSVLAVPVNHAVPAVGYQVGYSGGKSFFFSGDTGPGLSACWKHISPQLMLIDVTLPNQYERHAIPAGHLTPRLLGQELAEFKKINGYLPPVVLIHISPFFEGEIKEEAAGLAGEFGTDITVAYEGMRLVL